MCRILRIWNENETFLWKMYFWKQQCIFPPTVQYVPTHGQIYICTTTIVYYNLLWYFYPSFLSVTTWFSPSWQQIWVHRCTAVAIKSKVYNKTRSIFMCCFCCRCHRRWCVLCLCTPVVTLTLQTRRSPLRWILPTLRSPSLQWRVLTEDSLSGTSTWETKRFLQQTNCVCFIFMRKWFLVEKKYHFLFYQSSSGELLLPEQLAHTVFTDIYLTLQPRLWCVFIFLKTAWPLWGSVPLSEGREGLTARQQSPLLVLSLWSQPSLHRKYRAWYRKSKPWMKRRWR